MFATVEGDTVRIGHYGTATRDVPVEVPDDVASQLEAEIAGLPAEKDERGNTVPGKVALPGRTDIRVERGQPGARRAPQAPTPPAAAPAAPADKKE